MIDLTGRTVLSDGTVICKQSALLELLYTGQSLEGLYCSDPDDQDEWIRAAKLCDSAAEGPCYVDKSQYVDINWYQYWSTPEPYASINLLSWCQERCSNEQEHQRLKTELELIKERQMEPLIRHLIYCADMWRQHGIVWGVGRGSSVCSFVLFLVGINRINPIEHGLDIKEWLK